MKKIFIDAGAHNGIATFEHYIIHRKDLVPCDIYYFEPLNDTYNVLYEEAKRFRVQYPDYNHYTFHQAVWIKEEKLNFFEAIDMYGTVGSTLHADKKEKLKLDSPELVECIDIEKFILDNFQKDDYIVLKLDVEGSEYKIIEHLLKNDNAIHYLNELLVEWHDNFYDNANSNQLTELLNQKQINHTLWLL